MRIKLFLGLCCCLFLTTEIFASKLIEIDSLNPLYQDLENGYQLNIKNVEVIKSLGKKVKVKYDIVNAGKHIVKLGKGRKAPNSMLVNFEENFASNEYAQYKVQIAEQILKSDIFIQSGKSKSSNEVKVDLNAPTKLAHMVGIGRVSGGRIAEATMEKVQNGSGGLATRKSILGKKKKLKAAIPEVDADMDDFDADFDADVNIDTDVAMVEKEIEPVAIPEFSEYTVPANEAHVPSTDRAERSKKKMKAAASKIKKKIKTPTPKVDVDSDFESDDFEMDVDTDMDVEVGEINMEENILHEEKVETVEVDPRKRGTSVVKRTKSYKEVESTDGTETHTITKTRKRISAIEAYPEDDSILATMKNKRKAKRDALKKDALNTKASASGSNVYEEATENMDGEMDADDFDSNKMNEIDPDVDLETEKEKWYEGFKPYAAREDYEEPDLSFKANKTNADYLDKSSCPDLELSKLKVVKKGKKWITAEFTVTNDGKGPAMIYGTTPKEGDNVYIKAHLSGSKKVSRGSSLLGGMFINKGVSNKAGKLLPGESMTAQMKIDIRKKTKFTSVLILELDAYNSCRECDETNNKNHVVLK